MHVSSQPLALIVLQYDKFIIIHSPLEAQGPWPSARSHACVSVVGGRVLVVGGQLPRDYRAVQAGRPNADLVDGYKQPAVVGGLGGRGRNYKNSVVFVYHRTKTLHFACPAVVLLSCLICVAVNDFFFIVLVFPPMQLLLQGARAGHGRGFPPDRAPEHENGALEMVPAPLGGVTRLAGDREASLAGRGAKSREARKGPQGARPGEP